jgi:GntR family transcriptional regulator
MEFVLNRTSGVATYQQLVQQVEQALRLEWLVPGDRLPTAKEVVAQLGINPNTVHKAYRELERAGLVEVRPGQGTFVRRRIGGSVAAQHPALRTDLDRWMASARDAGLDDRDIYALVDASLRAALSSSQDGVA